MEEGRKERRKDGERKGLSHINNLSLVTRDISNANGLKRKSRDEQFFS